MTESSSATAAFREARDLLLRYREDYTTARGEFGWPRLDHFNWALDWFDCQAAEHPRRDALRIVAEDSDIRLSYAELSARSNQVANWLRGLGVRRGDRVLVMLGNIAPLWEVILAAIKLGAVIIPATTLLGAADIADRIGRGEVRHVITESAQTPKFRDAAAGNGWTPVAVGEPAGGWHHYGDAAGSPAAFTPDGVSGAADPLLLYFTSGTTAQPKLVEHTHASYPVGHLSTMYWLGLQPGDVHLNISSPGWAKHAWSNVFAPWNAGATAFVLGHERFSVAALFEAIPACAVSTLCAPPTVWRMLIQADLTGCDTASLRECVSAGEPLNPEVIEQVRRAWGITVRDGYGQTETTAQIGNTPGQQIRPGSMGRPLPGYTITLIDPVTGTPATEGEICIPLDPAAGRPAGLMAGYRGDPQRAAEAMHDGYYHTGDVATTDPDGYITYVGRTDDVFKASDYRISPFELESVLIEHEAVAEAAVVPSPDPVRLAVPKAYIALATGSQPSAAVAESILAFARERLAPYKRIRRLEFADLPKTISGKIRRVQLRDQEHHRHTAVAETSETRGTTEFWEEDFPRLKG
ncbi:MAG TPA: AMP-binding protein [Streptosporangiaceae bacterium]|nr:AMP-binding protein [Streptosporangiaceae bacterium]